MNSKEEVHSSYNLIFINLWRAEKRNQEKWLLAISTKQRNYHSGCFKEPHFIITIAILINVSPGSFRFRRSWLAIYVPRLILIFSIFVFFSKLYSSFTRFVLSISFKPSLKRRNLTQRDKQYKIGLYAYSWYESLTFVKRRNSVQTIL